MSLPVGIDLGTTNSVISVYKRGRPLTLRVDGSDSVPSAVCFRDKNTTLVGVKALGMAMIRPEHTILSVKRAIGIKNASYHMHGETYTPIDISAKILEKLCEGHDEELGGRPENVVITVPAYFNDDQRRDTKVAGEQAGLNVLRLLPEPTAAAIAIGLDRGRDQTILVYDLGGGTFDISVLKVQNEEFAKFTVLAVNGNHDLGGNDFDGAIRNYAIDQFQKQHKVDLRKEDPTDPAVRQALQMLTSACERVKVELTDAEEAFLDLPNFYQGAHLETTLQRRTFEGLIKDLVYSTKDLVLATIGEAGLSVEDIDRLVLVGGSTKVPLIRRVLADTVKEPYVAPNVDLAVSHGAAIMAANLCAVDEVATGGDYAPVEIDVTDVVSHPISVGMNDERNRIACTTVIEKNSPLPSFGMTLGVALPGQVIGQLPVFRGSDNDPENNHYLGMLTLAFDSSRSHTFIRFEVSLDRDGVLQVEGATIDLQGRDPSELLWVDPKTLKVIRKVRAEIKITD